MKLGLLGAIVCTASMAHAATVYVVPDPSKVGPGTSKSEPTGKLCAAIENAKEGDVVQLAEDFLQVCDGIHPGLEVGRFVERLGGQLHLFQPEPVV